ncbi:MAG TPA: methyltransferase domain-containing protein [Aeromicrobium sp.]|nr:methyltransferase domain-containing protein [Aeromicrobium sp.]
MAWDPQRYLSFADERGRAFVELLARVGAEDPTTVVDLGSGPGTFTALLAQRWPHAHVIGIDSSPTMVEFAAKEIPGVDFVLADLHRWEPMEPIDVLISNATLHWVPGHLKLLPQLARAVAPGGWFAFQVPGNFHEPSHTIRRELETLPEFAPYAESVSKGDAHDAGAYLHALTDLGCTVDAWETTYLHVLHGRDPVFEWVATTSARPTLDALPADVRVRFEAEFKSRLNDAYPVQDGTVVLPFRRVFVVARVPYWDD